ncbi:MAG: ferrochelatase, partial [Acidobacteriia bacterium]|nr:ferrochelatase [Terriglobia bacterium]
MQTVKQGVLLLAHGAPERVEDVESYLSYVRGGRPCSPEVLKELRGRYEAIGGSSPLLRWTPGVTAASHEVYVGATPDLSAADYRG